MGFLYLTFSTAAADALLSFFDFSLHLVNQVNSNYTPATNISLFSGLNLHSAFSSYISRLMVSHATYSLFFNQLLIPKMHLYESRFILPVDARVSGDNNL